MNDKLYKASTILITFLAITGFALWIIVLHELVHWHGVEEPIQLCVGTGIENNRVGVVRYHGEAYWFGTEWFASLTSIILTLSIALPIGYWITKRT